MSTRPKLSQHLLRGGQEFNQLRQAGKIGDNHLAAYLEGICVLGADLSRLKLTMSHWQDCQLTGVSFRDADLSNAYFAGGRLEDCDFTGANLQGAKLERVVRVGCDFSKVKGSYKLVGEDGDAQAVSQQEVPARKPPPPTLGERLPKGYEQWPLEQLLEEIAKHTKVDVGSGASEAEIQALQTWAKAAFPDDYRTFLRRFGRLSIIGDDGYAFGTFEVYGVPDLSSAVDRYRDELGSITDSGSVSSWLERRVELPSMPQAKRPSSLVEPGPGLSLEEKRRALCERLGLTEQHVPFFADDLYDKLRIAYHHMVPIMATPDMFHHSVHCVGPGARLYTVSIKRADVEPASGTFLSRLYNEIAGVVVRPA